MPYLRITCAELDAERRRIIAVRLTKTVNDLLFNPRGRLTREELRERTTVHFAPYGPGELFIGGQTPEARASIDVTLELSDWGMSGRQRRRLARGLTPVLAELFAVPREAWDGINIRFHSYNPPVRCRRPPAFRTRACYRAAYEMAGGLNGRVRP